jgi:hypothetical protein
MRRRPVSSFPSRSWIDSDRVSNSGRCRETALCQNRTTVSGAVKLQPANLEAGHLKDRAALAATSQDQR